MRTIRVIHPVLCASVLCLHAASETVCAQSEPENTVVEASAELEPYTQSIENTLVEFSMVPVRAGSVTLTTGESTTANVYVLPFWIASTETTWDLYDVFMYKLDGDDIAGQAASKDDKPNESSAPAPDAISRPTKPYMPPDRGYGHAGYPAMSITFEGAETFCAWLSARTGRTYRLPTEAEWALVAERASTDASGEDINYEKISWHVRNDGGTTHPVGRLARMEPGVHDIFGNVAEWVVGHDGIPVAAGGSYIDPPTKIGPDARVHQTSRWNMSDPQFPKSPWWLSDCSFVGFRVVCEVDGQAEPEPADAKDK